MPPFSFTLRHNAATFDWELAAAGDAAPSHHATHSSAFRMLAANPLILARGATVRVFGADGGYEHERTYAPAALTGSKKTSKSNCEVAVSTVAL